jgi:Ca2+:H+ antiporter
MKWLLLFVPFTVLIHLSDADPSLVFGTALVAILPLVEIMGDATERLAGRLGTRIGGLLNATLANAPELIIGLTGLTNGLGSVVKASLTGSILVNLLVGLGCALVIGGLKFGSQRFERQQLRTASSMLLLCSFCFIVPAVFRAGVPAASRELSTEIAVVLLLVYGFNLVATVFNRRPDASGPLEMPGDPVVEPALVPEFFRLGLAAAALALVSDILTESLQPMAQTLGFSDVFSGVVLLGGVGGCGEVLTAIRFARSGRQELVLAVTVGSTIQMVLLVAPLLVLLGPMVGEPIDLAFSTIEVVAIVIAVAATRGLITDGRVTWMEGVLLLATYAIFAFAFFHVPDGGDDAPISVSVPPAAAGGPGAGE